LESYTGVRDRIIPGRDGWACLEREGVEIVVVWRERVEFYFILMEI